MAAQARNQQADTFFSEFSCWAAGPAAPAAAAAAAAAGAASLQNAPFATPKHHATEGRNNLQNMRPRGLTSLLDSGKNKAIAAAGPAAAAPCCCWCCY